jgi:hypothetical protein
MRVRTSDRLSLCPPDGLPDSSVVKEPRTSRLQGGHIMNADDLKKLTTDALDRLARLLNDAQLCCRWEALTTMTSSSGQPSLPASARHYYLFMSRSGIELSLGPPARQILKCRFRVFFVKVMLAGLEKAGEPRGDRGTLLHVLQRRPCALDAARDARAGSGHCGSHLVD